MNEERTPAQEVIIEVIGYADGIYNLEVIEAETGDSEKVDITREQAGVLCGMLDVDLPDPDPEPPERWG